MITIRKRTPLLPHNRSRPSELPCLKLNFCCVGTFFAWLYDWFNSEWLLNHLKGLSTSKRVHWNAWNKHSELNFKYFEIWLFFALFGYFWDRKWLHDNTGNFWWLEVCQKQVSYWYTYHKTKKNWTYRVIFHILKIC